MDLTISRPVKILLLVLVLAGVGGIASLTMLGKSSGTTASPPVPSVAQIRARAHAHHTPTGVAKPAAKTAPKPAAKSAAPKVHRPAPTVGSNGLPILLVDALRAHPIVVVSVFDPQSETDAVSYAEARAGAQEAGVGFVGVSLLDNTVAAPLTAALPGGALLPDPGLLVYRRPGTLVQRIDGFADRDGVAALADAARTAPPLAAAATASEAPTTTTTSLPPLTTTPTTTTP